MLAMLAWSSTAFGGEIHDVLLKGDSKKAVALVESDPGVASSRNNDGDTPLHVVARVTNRWMPKGVYQQFEAVEILLLARKADINARNKYGFTPLHFAALSVWAGTTQTQFLLANGAEVDARNNDGNTPLFIAVFWDQKRAAEVLLKHGADINARNKNGDTPLHWAANRGHKGVAELLLAHGADVHAKEQQRQYAIAHGGVEMAHKRRGSVT